jgi:hypothetical protein
MLLFVNIYICLKYDPSLLDNTGLCVAVRNIGDAGMFFVTHKPLLCLGAYKQQTWSAETWIYVEETNYCFETNFVLTDTNWYKFRALVL